MSQLPDFKALKKLAKACREAGIKSFKNADIEFTLSDDAPVSNYKRRIKKGNEPVTDQTFNTDQLTQDQLLFYSAVDPSAPAEEEVAS